MRSPNLIDTINRNPKLIDTNNPIYNKQLLDTDTVNCIRANNSIITVEQNRLGYKQLSSNYGKYTARKWVKYLALAKA